MNSLLPSLSVLFRNSKRSLLYGSMAAIAIGLEELFESVVFNCPCEGHFAYGLAFLCVPALFLLLPGILLEKDLWRYPRRTNKDEKRTVILRYLKKTFATLDVFTRASIAPVAWLVLSFLQQQYYTCAYFGPPLDKEETMRKNTSDKCQFALGVRSKQLEESYKIRSQIAGWSIMLIIMSILFTSICIRRCLNKGKRLRMPSLEYYQHLEAKEALEQFHTKAKELAKQKAAKNIEVLFQSANNKKFDDHITEVSKNVLERYGMFFVIPPESPAYETPVILSDNPPQFPELFSVMDGPEVPKKEHDSHSELKRMEYSEQRQFVTENNKHGNPVSKVTLCRQISIDAVRK